MIMPGPRPLRIAHRGMPRAARENTLRSFGLALAAGADGVELDVHATADGIVVVHHDPVLEDGRLVSELSHDALLRATLASREIPTLGAVCELVRGRAELFVEIKGGGIERLVTGALAGYEGVAAIHSVDHALIQRLARGGTARRLGVLFEDATGDPLTLMATHGAQDLWPHHELVTRALVDDVHSIGGRVIPWTVNDPADAKRLTALGVDAICTDDVSMLAS